MADQVDHQFAATQYHVTDLLGLAVLRDMRAGAKQRHLEGEAARIGRQAIRVGDLEDSSLRARKLTETTKRMIGAPSYFQKFGRPMKIDDLNEHKLLHYSNQANGNVWKVTAPSGEKRQVRSVGWLTVNDGQSLLNAAVSGLGIAYLPSFLYSDAMKQGLVEEAIPGLPVEVLTPVDSGGTTGE